MVTATAARAGVLTGSGLFRVERGRGLGRVLAALLRMPRAGAAVPVALRVTRTSGGETWERDFGGTRLTTRQYVRDGLLVEVVGPLRLEFASTVEGDVLTLTAVRARLLGLPVPARVVATVRGDDGWLDVGVTISAPVAGLLLRYGGPLAFEER